MKYYAVTDDPNELYHYGRKGMKWGKHIFGDKPKSPAFKSAMTKLRTLSKKASSTIKTSRAQHAVNKERRQQDRYNKAVQAAQKRIQITENLHNLNNLQSYEKRVAQDYKQQRKADHAAEKRYNKFAKNERKMDKFTQLAREGRLKYGQLSDEQVGKITERLALERSARVLGNTEKPKFKTRMKEALQEGMLQGVVQGTAAGMREVAVAKVQNRLKNKHVLDKNSAQEAERQKQASRIKNKKTHKEVREDIKDEAYEAQIKAGESFMNRGISSLMSTKQAADALQKAQARINENRYEADRKLNERKRIDALQDRLSNERDESFHKTYLEEKGYRTDEDAFKAHEKILENNIYEMDKRWGKDSNQRYEALKKYHEFKSIKDPDEKKRLMNQYESDREKEKDSDAYDAFSKQQVEEAQKRIDIERQEKENAQLKAEYEADMDQWRKNEEYNKKLKDKYDQDLNKYNKDLEEYNRSMKEYNARVASGQINVKKPNNRPIPPNPPTYLQNPKPGKPNYKKIDYSSTSLPSAYTYQQYKRLSGMGINIYGNGGGKNKNKNKGGRN